jgi:hypothetical protein
MSTSDLSFIGLFNDHGMNVPSTPAVRLVEHRAAEGLMGGSLKEFPYADLIRDHLAHGRISDARKLFEFARDLIPAESKLSAVLAPPRTKRSDKRDMDRSADFRWLDENSTKFRGQWVALVGERLVASSDTLKKLLASLDQEVFEINPLIHHLD